MRLRNTLLYSLALLLAPPVLSAQLVCPSGVQPDGFINWSHLPAAPLITTGTTAPVTATFAVDGIPNLNVTVQIPALTGTSQTPIPAYTVNGDQLQLNAYTSSSQTSITLTFSTTIQGASVNASVAGLLNSLSLTAFNARNPQNVLSFSQGASEPGQFAPLQVRSVTPGYITSLSLSVDDNLQSPPPAIFSNLRIESNETAILGSLNIVPTDGLMQWLPSENASGTDWADASSNGHDATQTVASSQPAVTFDGPTCSRAVFFSNGSFMNFNLPIAGWSQMTVFLVAKSDADPTAGQFGSENAAIFWNENQNWGNTYVSPFWTHETFRFGTTQVGNDPNYKRPVTIGGDFTLTTAVHDIGTDSLYVNGTRVFQKGGKLSTLGGSDGTGFLGRGFNNSYFNGDIGEVLVYNRVLTEKETQAVTGYLESKFGLLPGTP